jgi:hypothetical protein
MVSDRSRLRNARDASNYLRDKFGISRTPSTLAKLRVLGTGPEFVKVGNRDVAYPEPALDAFAEALIGRPVRSTSEAA